MEAENSRSVAAEDDSPRRKPCVNERCNRKPRSLRAWRFCPVLPTARAVGLSSFAATRAGNENVPTSHSKS